MPELANVSHVDPNGTRALDNISLAFPKGMFGLPGPNGAGKSTLMRTVATLQSPTTGVDPGERNRFLNLRAEIGKDVVVILSTQILAKVDPGDGFTAVTGGLEIVYVDRNPDDNVIDTTEG